MDIVWDGITEPKTLTEEVARCRFELAEAARDYDWSRTLVAALRRSCLIDAIEDLSLSGCATASSVECPRVRTSGYRAQTVDRWTYAAASDHKAGERRCYTPTGGRWREQECSAFRTRNDGSIL